MDVVSIKIATAQDAVLISSISKQTFCEAFHAQNTQEDMDLFLAENFNVKDTLQEIENINNTFLLAYVDEGIAGYAKIHSEDNGSTFPNAYTQRISRIYVLNEWIGKGIGKVLMKHCVDAAITAKKDLIWLGVWEHNLPAIEFYQRWGFEKFDEEIFVLGKDVQHDWLMKKVLKQ